MIATITGWVGVLCAFIAIEYITEREYKRQHTRCRWCGQADVFYAPHMCRERP